MAKFSDRQKKIAVELLNGNKTVQELSQILKIHEDDIKDSLNLMKELKLVSEKNEKFSLSEKIVKDLKNRQNLMEQDPFDIRISAIIEMQAVEKDLLQKTVNDLEKAIKKEKRFTVYSTNVDEVKELDTGYYSTLIDLNLTLKDFRSLIYFIYFYGPSSVEILRPNELKIKADDLQEGLMDALEMIHKYNNYVSKILSKEDVEKLMKKIYK